MAYTRIPVKKVAILGAGISGLSCARVLRAAGLTVKLFEKARRPGGRCATRLWQGHLVDHGASFITAQTAEFKRELLQHLPHFRPIIPAVVDEKRDIVPNASGPRFYVIQGNNFFGHILSQDLEVQTECKIESITPEPEGIRCQEELFSALVSTLPGPQSAQLLGLDPLLGDYAPCLTGIFEYAGRNLDLAKRFYAQQELSGRNIIRFSACENHKLGRIVGEKTVFVVRASPAFSEQYLEEPPDLYLPLLARENEALWELPSHLLTASFSFRWRYAFPRNPGFTVPELPPGLFLSGDFQATDFTIEGAWQSGRQTAFQVLSYLRKND